MIGQIAGGHYMSVDDLMAMADETQQVLEYSSRLEAQQEELSRTARQLAAANEKLTRLSVQKDAFLSQISHELRTPMTSIRAFSEILAEEGTGLSAEERRRYARVIQDETIRLTRLLDDLLDLSVLENGRVSMDMRIVTLAEVLERALASTASIIEQRGVAVRQALPTAPVTLSTDPGRLAQVFINLIANAVKYNDTPAPTLDIRVSRGAGRVMVDIVDNGAGIEEAHREVIFEKFSRLSDQAAAGSAGLGLAICREIMDKLGGSIEYLPGQGGAAFRVTLPGGGAEVAQ